MQNAYIDLTSYAAESKANYNDIQLRIANLYSGQALVQHKIGIQHVFVSTCNALELAKLYCEVGNTGKLLSDYDKLPVRSEHSYFGTNDKWRGMNAYFYNLELIGVRDSLQANLEAARVKLNRTGVKEALEQEAVTFKKKRKRVYSEHDGDFDFDRKFDINPFQSTLHELNEFPYIELCFPMNMSCSASASEIASFNARCLALAEVLETAGYRVAITGESWNRGYEKLSGVELTRLRKMGAKIPAEENTHLTRLEIRSPDQYGDSSSFAVLASVEFFRRAMFSMLYASFAYQYGLRESAKNQADSGLGKPLRERPLPANPGQVILTPELVAKIFSLEGEELTEEFKKRFQFTTAA